MGKTLKKKATEYHMFRKPKGYKKALINNARLKAIPPNSWDDMFYSRESRIIERYAKRLKVKKISNEIILQKVSKKFKISIRVAKEALQFVIN